METETAGRFRLRGNAALDDWPLAMGSRETLAGKIPANIFAALLFDIETPLPTWRGRLMGRNEVLPPDDRLGCVGRAGWLGFRGEGPTGG